MCASASGRAPAPRSTSHPMLSDATAWFELLPPDTLRAVLSLLSTDDLSSAHATSSAMSTAASGDALWQQHALQMPRWQRCGNPLPSQADGRWSSSHAFCRASRSRCTHCAPTIDAPAPAGVLAPSHPTKRPWRVSGPALARARGLANVALEACVVDLLACLCQTPAYTEGTRLAVAVWLTRHDAVTGSTAGIGARCWHRRCAPTPAPTSVGSSSPGREAWTAELASCADLPRASTPPPGWAAVGPAHAGPPPLYKPRHVNCGCPHPGPPSLQLEQSEWAALERWAVRHQDPEQDVPRTGPLSSTLALKTRTAALAFAEQLVAGKCILLFEVTCHHEAACLAVQRPLLLRRESLTAWHLPSREQVSIA